LSDSSQDTDAIFLLQFRYITFELSSGTKNRYTSRRDPRRARRVSGMLGSAQVILLGIVLFFIAIITINQA